jgi:amino acid adenylation domain-containing protein
MVETTCRLVPETESKNLCMHRLFESQAENIPDAIAVISDERYVTYKDLNRRANQLARYLGEMGVGPEVRVGIAMERRIELIVAILGILKAGGVYLPLDPSHPEERLAYILQDAEVSLLLTQDDLLTTLPNSMGLLISLDSVMPDIVRQKEHNPTVGITARNAAYVIYTSGSTGVPKGVLIEHGTVRNTLVSAIEAWDIKNGDRVLQLYSFSFDASVLDLFMAISTGAALYLTDKNVRFAGLELVQVLASEAITIATLPPSLLAYLPSGDLPALREVISGGESVPWAVASRWASGRRFFCVYGPTEASIAASWYRVGELPAESKTVPIGRAISNTAAYTVDSSLQLSEFGSAGELFISGAGLARGYVNAPDLTAERFLPDPFDRKHGNRMYKTGDLVSYMEDGNIEFLGRTDNQVKIRGFRIEIGEIESVLNEHPSIRKGVVVARDQAGEKRLAAYVIPEVPKECRVGELQKFLASRLPDYMVPSDFVVTSRFPLTPQGKVDRRGLPAPDRNRADLDSTYLAPQNKAQEVLVTIWEEILGVKGIGVNDNFFDLGGNSLQAADFMNRLQEIGGEFVHIVTLFDHPTVADLAVFLAEGHPRAVIQMRGLGAQSAPQPLATPETQYRPINRESVRLMRGLIQPLPPLYTGLVNQAPKNPRAVFILSPPRSGSTLFRVMLAGNPSLFAPPELQLLCFNTLGDRREAFSGRYTFWLEGLIRAVIELKDCDTNQARSIIEACEDQDMTVQEFYSLMQEWLRDRILVDKTPGYALDIDVLKRAEDYFEDPLYIHLVRHPYGMIKSFEDAKLEQIFKYKHSFAPRELGELMWLVSHQNIVEFLKTIPGDRHYSVRFEELVDAPATVIEGVCQFLGIDFHAGMLEPHDGRREKMTDGIHSLSRMLGDIKFHEHKQIEKKTADRWKDHYTTDFLGDITWQLAEALGYESPKNNNAGASVSGRAVMPLRVLPRDGSMDLPLSYIQQRIWFMDQLEPGMPAYNIRAGAYLHGLLNPITLEQAVNAIIARHETLRTGFGKTEGKPSQFILPVAGLLLPVVDLGAIPKAKRDPVLTGLARDVARRRFRLEEAPLLRITVFRLEYAEYFIGLSIHHIVSDGVTLRAFFGEQETFYNAFRQGQPASLADLPLQYADFSYWQRQWLDGESLRGRLSSCVRQLAGAPASAPLTTDRPRPAMQTFNGARETFEISPDLSDSIKTLSRRQGVTLFMVLLSGFETVLHLYSGQEDILLAISVTNRTRSEFEKMMGPIINNILVRSDFSGRPTLEEVLRRVRGGALAAYSNQHLPLERLLEELNPERDLSRAPYQDIVFNIEPPPLSALKIDGLKVDPVPIDNGTSKFDLFFTILDNPERIDGWFEYNTDLYDAATIRRLLGHYQVVLETFVTDTDLPISSADLLTPPERRQLLVEFNSNHADYPCDVCLHRIVEAQVDRSPDRVAVSFSDDHLTYLDLDLRANQISNRLRRLGVENEVPVGICAERSLEMVTGLLGVLKAGAPFVPLDPSYPADRLSFMVENSGISVVLTQQTSLAKLPDFRGKALVLDSQPDAIESESPSRSPWPMSECNSAYVIYTSGSTGTPKGAINTHRAVCNRLIWMQESMAISEDDAVLQKTSFNFDVSVWEFFWPLVSGARLVLSKPGGQRDNAYLADVIARERISTLHFVPSMLRMFLEGGYIANCPSLRRVICSGEALSLDLQERFLSASGARLYNLYGPTETAIDVTSWTCGPRADKRVPIGRPIANTSAFILNGYLQPLPVGVPGEVCIGGYALARGYVNRPDLTAEKFIPNPFGGGAMNDRLYKTGDLTRYLEDGGIEFLGRIDHQVKVRGFRIELPEIEAAMGAHPSIKQACAIAREDGAGSKQIIGYLVLDRGRQSSVRDVREFLLNKLPDYMVPSVFVPLDAIPLGPNGKINTRALPQPDGSRPELEVAFVPPATPVEEAIEEIWEEVLRIERIGIHDDFFQLGGHSLLMIQVLSRILDRLNVELPLQTFFKLPTVAGLAAEVARARIASSGADQINELLARIERFTDAEVRTMLTKGETV